MSAMYVQQATKWRWGPIPTARSSTTTLQPIAARGPVPVFQSMRWDRVAAGRPATPTSRLPAIRRLLLYSYRPGLLPRTPASRRIAKPRVGMSSSFAEEAAVTSADGISGPKALLSTNRWWSV